MPTVPGQPQVADPFGNYAKGKNQSRMASGNVVPIVKPSETDIAIAMAGMHQMGRLVFDATPMNQDHPFGEPLVEHSEEMLKEHREEMLKEGRSKLARAESQ